MGSRIVSRVARAAAVALIVEVTDLALDRAGLTTGKYRVPRKMIKAGTAAVTGMMIAKLLRDADAG
jgi:hypothetical protein